MGGSFQASLKPGVRYEAWVQGSFGPGIALASPKGEIGRVSRDLGTREQWTSLGTITGDGAQTLHVKPATTSELSPGSKLQDQFSAFAFAPVGATEKLATVTPAEARDYCGKPVDWIEVQN
jgi:hypothetical protein